MSKCKLCKRENFRAKMGLDTCGCEEYDSAVTQPKLNVTHSKPVTHKNVTQCNTGVPKPKRCKCGQPRVEWSHSYCRGCEAKRVKAWRRTASV